MEEWLVTDKRITYKEYSELNLMEQTALTARAMKEIKDSLKDLKSSITSFNSSLFHSRIMKDKWVEILGYSPIFAGSIGDLKRTIASYEDVHRSIVYRNRFFFISFVFFAIYAGVPHG